MIDCSSRWKNGPPRVKFAIKENEKWETLLCKSFILCICISEKYLLPPMKWCNPKLCEFQMYPWSIFMCMTLFFILFINIYYYSLALFISLFIFCYYQSIILFVIIIYRHRNVCKEGWVIWQLKVRGGDWRRFDSSKSKTRSNND